MIDEPMMKEMIAESHWPAHVGVKQIEENLPSGKFLKPEGTGREMIIIWTWEPESGEKGFS